MRTYTHNARMRFNFNMQLCGGLGAPGRTAVPPLRRLPLGRGHVQASTI
jgi:hypothetical protein